MTGDTDSSQSQQNLDPQQGNQKEDTIAHGAPHKYERYDFGSQRDGFAFTKLANVGP